MGVVSCLAAPRRGSWSMKWLKICGIASAVFGVSAAGCARDDGEGSEPAAARIEAAVTAGPCSFAAEPAPGASSNRTFTIKVPNGKSRAEFALATAGGSLTLGVGAQVLSDSGGFASVSSVEATNRCWRPARAHTARLRS